MLAEVSLGIEPALSQNLFGRCCYSVSAASGAIDPVEIKPIPSTSRRSSMPTTSASRASLPAWWATVRAPKTWPRKRLEALAHSPGAGRKRRGLAIPDRRPHGPERAAQRPPPAALRIAGRRSAQPPTPEEAHAAAEEREQVRRILAGLPERQSELLVLRSSGLTYDELAAALGLNPAPSERSMARAQQAFRKEYLKQYGTRRNGR